MLNEGPGFALTSSPESVSLKMDPTGKVYVALQAPFWGNSPETVATQVLAEQLQIDPQDIIVTYSDSDHGLNGTGPGGSRFTVMLAGAVVGAAHQLREKLIRVAAHMMRPTRTTSSCATAKSASGACRAWRRPSPKWPSIRIISGCPCPTIRA